MKKQVSKKQASTEEKRPPVKRRYPRGQYEKAALETRVSTLLLVGLNKQAIAKELNIPAAWVTKIEGSMHKGFKQLSSETVEVLRQKETAKLGWMQEEAIKAFTKSKTPRVITVVEGRPSNVLDKDGNPKASPTKIIKTTEERAGDTKHIDTAVKISERFSKIMGLDQPIELKHIHQRYEEAKELLMQAVIDVVTDPVLLQKIAQRLRELEEQSIIGKEIQSGIPS